MHVLGFHVERFSRTLDWHSCFLSWLFPDFPIFSLEVVVWSLKTDTKKVQKSIWVFFNNVQLQGSYTSSWWPDKPIWVEGSPRFPPTGFPIFRSPVSQATDPKPEIPSQTSQDNVAEPKIQSPRSEAKDPKPKIQSQRPRAKELQVKIPSQSSNAKDAKDPKPKIPSQRSQARDPKSQISSPRSQASQTQDPKLTIPSGGSQTKYHMRKILNFLEANVV